MDKKTSKLKKIRDDIWNLKESPLYDYRTSNNYYPVLGEGNHDADIMFVGEAPGKNEAEQGKPFCGAAGRVLTELIESIDLTREDVYITNIVKDRPPENRDPTPEEIELYAPYLLKQIDIIQPKVLATLGRFSSLYMLEKYETGEHTKTISQLRGTVVPVKRTWGKLSIIPLFHPAVALYNGSQKQVLLSDMKVVKDTVKSS